MSQDGPRSEDQAIGAQQVGAVEDLELDSAPNMPMCTLSPQVQHSELSQADGPEATSMSEDQSAVAVDVLIRLPSGSLLPMRGLCSDRLATWKGRVLSHCGVSPDKASDFGLALGFAALNEQATASANDVCHGDTLSLFERASAVQSRETALANLS